MKSVEKRTLSTTARSALLTYALAHPSLVKVYIKIRRSRTALRRRTDGWVAVVKTVRELSEKSGG